MGYAKDSKHSYGLLAYISLLQDSLENIVMMVCGMISEKVVLGRGR